MTMKLKSNNKGMSLIMVIAVISLVTIFATVALALGVYNYRMKQTNKLSKNNFYDAERVLDEIRLGLQSDVSDAMSQAYVDTMSKYSDTYNKNAKRTENFQNIYVNVLRERLESGDDANCYDMEYLLDFLDERVKQNTVLTTISGKKPTLIANENGLALKNLYLKYTDSKGMMTEVMTDIQIQYPQIDFTQTGSYPNVPDYIMIAQEGISVQSYTSQIDMDGSIYAGGAGLTLGNGNKVYITPQNEVVTNNTLLLDSKSEFHADKKVAVWTRDINVANASKLILEGTSYVANDLTLVGGADVTLGGDYYGFGNPKTAIQADNMDNATKREIEDDPAAYSSAILINAIGSPSKAKLNLKNMMNLVLAGNAYIGDSSVMMGESLTVKSNQLAYLVPESCLGTSNPMTNAVHTEKLNETGQTDATSKERVFKSKILEKVKAGVAPQASEITMITSGNMYYYYIQFDNAKAANDYFKKYFHESGAKIKDYLTLYVEDKALTVNENPVSKKALNGNILVYDELGVRSLEDTITQGTDLSDSEEYRTKEIKWQEMYGAYNTNLTVNYDDLTGAQKQKTVFENLVRKDELFKIAKSGWFLYTEGQGTNKKEYAAYFIDNPTTALKIDVSFLHSAPKGAEVTLVIATGDIEVAQDFDGTMIAEGKITVEPHAMSMSYNKKAVALANLISGGTYYSTDESKNGAYNLQDYLIDSERYTGRTVSLTHDKGKGNKIHLEDLVVYTNWSKR